MMHNPLVYIAVMTLFCLFAIFAGDFISRGFEDPARPELPAFRMPGGRRESSSDREERAVFEQEMDFWTKLSEQEKDDYCLEYFTDRKSYPDF